MPKLTIIGNSTLEIGKQNQYSIVSLGFNPISYNNPFSPQKPLLTEWTIYVLEAGNWRKTTENTKYGDTVSYTFTQKSLTRKGIKLKVIKGEDSGELIIKPKSAKNPKIIKIELLDINGKKVTKPLSYMDTLVAKAHCTDMEGQTLHFTLWEDDAQRPGHDSINEKNKINIFPVPATVKKGIAEAKFNMAQYAMASMIANMQVAKGDKNEGKTHEYYVTAEYFGKLEASNNVNLKNPAYNPDSGTSQKAPANAGNTNPKSPASSPKPNKNPVPVSAPKKETYKAPVTSGSKTKAPDSKGKIVKVSFVDKNDKPINNFKTIQGVIAKIETKNMVGRSVKLTIWEEDTISNDKIWSELVKITKDVCYKGIPITGKMWEIGNDGGDSTTQEYFLEVEYAGDEIKSGVVTVDKDAPRTKTETGKSMTKVKGEEKKEDKKDHKCPNCEKDITADDLKTIFPNADASKRKIVADTYNKYMKVLNMNTCWNKAHFFAQAIVEGGKSLDLKEGEGFNYSAEALPDNFGAFSANGKRGGPPNELAYKYGRSRQNHFKADKKMIANIAYSNRKELGNIGGDDGWNYRGRGLIQITGREIYSFCNPYTIKYENTDVLSNPDLVGEKISLGVSTSMIFFLWKKNKKGVPLNKLTLGTKDAKGVICPLVGNNVDIKDKSGKKITTNWNEKQDNFDKITSIIFIINQCNLTKNKNSEQPKDSKVIIKFGENADKSVVSEKSLNILREVGEQTKNYLITITSTARDPYNQARVMYDNIIKKGMKEQRKTYKEPGQRVLDAYESAKAKGKNKEGTIKEMEMKIKEIGPSKVSRHCGDPNFVNVFDVTQGMSNPQDFKKVITPKIKTLLDENGCYHLEIPQ
ncbi:hypothetical protein [Chryseobacterium sp.]|jgi:predicted chitinase|uniref:glycoside hydrolase family 19 protein n=1 Tax=Chryseobacterium sp. TaxID=1871047 RepID=UPI002850E815|nr:hypothetical protein [Chryseobacterium sp.]MDR3025138.1 hypothetical protein [Chryseobacterium sp.]